ncbi:hypothetical protein OT109_19090 [Phycisphaeraceae bacterium D3-23]
MTRKPYRPVYAVLRIDTYLADLALRDPDNPSLESLVAVKQVHFAQAEAEAEVKRLNEIKADKGSHYFWQYSRLITDPA